LSARWVPVVRYAAQVDDLTRCVWCAERLRGERQICPSCGYDQQTGKPPTRAKDAAVAPMARTTKETPAARRSALNTSLALAGCAVVELVAWGAAWVLDWQVGALAGAVAVSMGVAGVMVGMQRRKR
jgi:hypothetical protein